ncbi:hypothetical protein [Corynebacterium matruchotii]|uniref:hypothetical protein n=1 Tax=Corynebacterium matruchotii TaxID=43768 RepID=UPI0028F0F5AF|nr:hypothetical protein [Corynebacterium matruchotii]
MPDIIKVDLLDFDARNARLTLNEAPSQDELVQEIARVEWKSCIELLKHIVKYGQLSPLENILLLSHGNRYIVLEGNRRLFALRLLNQHKPTLQLLDERKQTQVESIVKGHKPITEVRAVIFEHRVDAAPWITLKHASGQGGAAMKPWRAFEKDRDEYNRNPDNCPKTLAFFYTAINLRGSHKGFADVIDRVLENGYTNLERIITSSFFEEMTGITISGTMLRSPYGEKYVHNIVMSICEALANKEANSRDLNKTTGLEKFIRSIVEKHESSKTPNEKVELDAKIPQAVDKQSNETSQVPSSAGTQTALIEPATKKQQTRTKQNKQTALAEFTPSNLGDKLNQMVREAQKLTIHNYPEILFATYRILLDLSCDYYVKEKGIDIPSVDICKRVLHVLEHISPEASNDSGRVQHRTPLQTLYQKFSNTPPKILQTGVHVCNVVTNIEEVEKYDSQVRKVLEAINDALGQNRIL